MNKNILGKKIQNFLKHRRTLNRYTMFIGETIPYCENNNFPQINLCLHYNPNRNSDSVFWYVLLFLKNRT